MSPRTALLLPICPVIVYASNNEPLTVDAGALRIVLDPAGYVVSLSDAIRHQNFAGAASRRCCGAR